MLSSRLVEARPVRTVASLCRKSSITFSILFFVSLLISLTIFVLHYFEGIEVRLGVSLLCARSGAGPDDRTYALACHRAFDVAVFGHIKDEDLQVVVFAERDGGSVHKREFFLQDSIVTQLFYLHRVRILPRVGCVDTPDPGRLHQNIRLNLQRAHGRGRVRGEEWLSDSGGEDDDPTFFEMADGPAADERLRDLTHLYRGDYAGEDIPLFKRVLQRDGVHDRRQHSHVIRGGSIHSRRAFLESAKDVSPADDQRDLGAEVVHLFNFLGDATNHIEVNPITDLTH